MVRDLVVERAAAERGEDAGSAPPSASSAAWDVCPAGCCPNPRGDRPALCGSDS